MDKYRVQSGKLDCKIKSTSHEQAALDALRSNKKTLSLIVVVHKKKGNPDEDMIFSTAYLFEKLGIKIENQSE
jgi:DUF1009 family protein